MYVNIRPIDLQVLIPQATEVSKTQHTANQHNSAQQQDFASQWQQIAQNRQRQVQNINQPDGGKVSRKHDQQQEKRSKHDEAERRRKNQTDEVGRKNIAPQSGQSNSGLGTTIDIKT